MYFKHIYTYTGNSWITVAYEVNRDEIKMGMSFCSPKEKSFKKKKGREEAVKRMETIPLIFKYHCDFVSARAFVNKNFNILLKKYIELLNNTKNEKGNNIHINWVEKARTWEWI